VETCNLQRNNYIFIHLYLIAFEMNASNYGLTELLTGFNPVSVGPRNAVPSVMKFESVF